MIIADKTIANVLAYAWIVLQTPPGSREAAVLEAMNAFCQAWAPTYDAVFYCCDRSTSTSKATPTAPRSSTSRPRPTATPSSWRP